MYVEGDVPFATSGCNNGGGNGIFGGDAWAAIILFALIFGWGRNGFGGQGGGYSADLSGALTRGDLCQDMNFNNLENAVRGISQGICDSTYALNNTITSGNAALTNAITQGFYGTQSAIQAQGYESRLATQSLSAQLASCCCDIQRGQDRLACQQATDTGAIISAGQANTQRILDYLCQEKISSLQAENSLLTAQLSQNSQTNTIINALRPTPVPAFPASNLYGYYGSGCGCQNSCGCNNGYGYGSAF